MTDASKERSPQDQANIGLAIQFDLIEKVFTTIWLIIQLTFWGWIAYVIYLAVKVLAGHQTSASFLFGLFTDNSNSEEIGHVAWGIVSFLLFVWAKTERWLRLRKVASMSKRIHELEKHIDPARTTSGLTPSGETPMNERRP